MKSYNNTLLLFYFVQFLSRICYVHARLGRRFSGLLAAKPYLLDNPLMGTGSYSATSNNMKLVHWPLMGGLLRLVQR